MITRDQSSDSRPQSALDDRADAYVRGLAKLDPIAATEWGVTEETGDLPDFSPAGYAALDDLSRTLLRDLDTLPLVDETDAVTAAALRETLEAELALADAGEGLSDLNNIASPLQQIRDSFDLMSRDTESDWDVIAHRLDLVPAALAGHRESLGAAAAEGRVAALRQVGLVAQQARALCSADGALTGLAAEAVDSDTATEAIRRQLAQGLESARPACEAFADFLERELAPFAPADDAVGRERYARFSRSFVGATIDLDETYEWGLQELAAIDAEQHAIVRDLYGDGVSVREGLDRLNADPELQLHGTDALREWMQGLADGAIADLDGTHFDIPAPAHTIECMVTESGDGGIYYTGPSADWSRPGRMWWAVPPGEDTFHTWQERTTVFHEGVPGHHLQVSQAVFEADSLNLWRRFASWNSGHGEGWALYAEGLMAELGFQDDPRNRMGMLDGMRLRAARVCLDIGVHLGKPRPDGQGTWDADYAWEFLKDNVAMADGFLRFELDRYLGWPGQAPSYKVGMRLWQQLRADWLAANPGKGLKEFHTRALSLGGLPMATLRSALLPHS